MIKKKALLREVLIFGILFIAGFLVEFVGLLIGQGLRCLFSGNDSADSLLRFLFDSFFQSALIWWVYGILLLIALRFPIIGFVFIVFSVISGILSIPNLFINYLVLPKCGLGLFSSTTASAVESQLAAVAILLSVILFKVNKSKTISYFVPLCLIASIHLLLNLQTGILYDLFIILQTAVFVVPYFLEKRLQELFIQ